MRIVLRKICSSRANCSKLRVHFTLLTFLFTIIIMIYNLNHSMIILTIIVSYDQHLHQCLRFLHHFFSFSFFSVFSSSKNFLVFIIHHSTMTRITNKWTNVTHEPRPQRINIDFFYYISIYFLTSFRLYCVCQRVGESLSKPCKKSNIRG